MSNEFTQHVSDLLAAKGFRHVLFLENIFHFGKGVFVQVFPDRKQARVVKATGEGSGDNHVSYYSTVGEGSLGRLLSQLAYAGIEQGTQVGMIRPE